MFYICRKNFVIVDETKIDGIPVYEIYKNRSLQNMTGEEWKDIEGYEGLYIVSNLGRVKSLGNGKSTNPKMSKEIILAQSEVSRYNYLKVSLCKDGNIKQCRVNRLVADTFIPNPENKPEVNHISEPLYDKDNKDLAKKDNRVANLEWCDRQYNNEYSFGKKVICVDTEIVYKSSHEAERQTGVCYQNILAACKGKYKTAGGYRWRFYDC